MKNEILDCSQEPICQTAEPELTKLLALLSLWVEAIASLALKKEQASYNWKGTIVRIHQKPELYWSA
ncbi:hypothetical protein H6G35_07260 [Aulosira sp. FACHB-113]|uniref:hypothetical protein n=1 Tax=Tolypothrix tenuis TaxID=457083 RepID=UPI001685746C|nr:hypothetical protein [Aulosira sp. FACHB-113]